MTTNRLPEFQEKMKYRGLGQAPVDTFSYYYRRIVSGKKGLIFEDDINPPAKEEIANPANPGNRFESGRKMLPKTVLIILNGGLGTGMGLTVPKSILKIKGQKSLLVIKLENALAKGIKPLLMNSFSSDKKTSGHLDSTYSKEHPVSFLQDEFPKILKDDLSPAKWPRNSELEWNPYKPGPEILQTI